MTISTITHYTEAGFLSTVRLDQPTYKPVLFMF